MAQSQRFASTQAPAAPGVDAVIARMRALALDLPPRDGVAVFNRVYLSVTEAVGRAIEGGAAGGFPDRAAASTLGVRFAERYLAAVDAASLGAPGPACWR